MEVLCSDREEVRINAVSVVSHLHNSKSIRDNGSITVLAFLHNEESNLVKQAVNSFFIELINTSGSDEVLLNTIIPDVITRFTELLHHINHKTNLKYLKNINLYNILYKSYKQNKDLLKDNKDNKNNKVNNDKSKMKKLIIEAQEKKNITEHVMKQFSSMIEYLISLAEE